MQNKLESSWWMLRIGLGAAPVLAGLDKIFSLNLLADWPSYISPLAAAVLPMSGAAFMQIVGVIEVAAGLAVLTFATRLGAYVVAAWLAAIAINLITTGHYFDVAVRDLLLAIAAITLARLTEARQAESAATERSSVSIRGAVA
jgi:uncharacterized membrane protein YphA (DoxX/SURF4 family)